MPLHKIAQFIPRQSSIIAITDSATTSSSASSSTDLNTVISTQASIITSTTPATLPTSGTASNDPALSSTSSLSSAQPTSSQDVGTTSTTAPPPSTSTSDIPSTLQISTSTSTSQHTTSAAPSTHPPTFSSSSPVSFTTPTSTTPTSTDGGQITSYITSSYVTVIGTSSFTTESLIPTTISSNVSNNPAGNRTAIIAGSVIGGGLLLIMILSIFFYRQRQRFKRFHFLDTINTRRREANARATLLAGEDLDDVDLARPPPGRYSDYDSPWDPNDSSGSLGDSEHGRLMNPLVRGVDIDLSHIVDDVMGPSTSGPGMHYFQNSVSSFYRDLPGRDETTIGGDPHTRELSNASHISLLEAAGLAGPIPSPLGRPENETNNSGQ